MEERGRLEATVTEAAVCLACGCLCDDLTILSRDERAIEVDHACEAGRRWLLGSVPEAGPAHPAEIRGMPAEVNAAVAHAAALVARAKAPLVLGLARVTNQTVAAVLALADRIGAAVEVDVAGAPARTAAFQRTGRVSATLGEVKNRADVVVFWGADPVRTHPRHWSRYAVEPRGRFVPEGRAGRTVIVVDEGPTDSSRAADRFVPIDPDRQFEVLWTLRALVRGVPIDPDRARKLTGTDPAALAQLAREMQGARYGALFHGSTLSRGAPAQSQANHEAVYQLVRDLSRQTRFVVLGMGEPGNGSGAEAVLAWQTGFPASVDFSPGHPFSLPGHSCAGQRLRRGEADLALIVGDGVLEALDEEAKAALRAIPVVVIASPPGAVARAVQPEVWCHAAIPGIEEAGTVVRVDGIALPLRPIRAGRYPAGRRWVEWIDQESNRLSHAATP